MTLCTGAQLARKISHITAGARPPCAGGNARCGGGSGSNSLEAVGGISLGISDAPISGASKVCIAFAEIEFQRNEGLTRHNYTVGIS